MSNALVPTDANSAFRLAEMMCKGKLVPEHLRNSPGDCLMIVEQAMRWNMSPFAVAQCTSAPKGKLMFEGKLVAAAIQTCGIMDGRLDYEFSGSGPDRTITVSGKIKGGTGIKTITLRLADAATDNIHWKKQPDQQLVYAGVRVWGRRWAPEVMLGVYSPEEMEPEKPDTFKGTTIESTATPVEPVNTPPKQSPQDRAAELVAQIEAAQDDDALQALHERVGKAIEFFNTRNASDIADDLADTFMRRKQALAGEEAAA